MSKNSKYLSTHMKNIDEKELIQFYNEGYSSCKLASKYKVTTRTIINRLIKNKIKRRTNIEAAQNSYKKGERKGLIHTDKWKQRIRESNSGEKNNQWKGDNVGLSSLHEWIKNHKLKPQFCENCKIKVPKDLANISQQYKRDINDFEWLCRKCHMIKDKRINNLKQYQNVKTI